MTDVEQTVQSIQQFKHTFVSYISDLHGAGMDREEAALYAIDVLEQASSDAPRRLMEYWVDTLYFDGQEFEIDDI